MDEQDLEKKIRARVRQRIEARKEVIIHLTAFILVNIGLWIVFPQPWPLIVTLGWTIGIVAHGLEYWNKHGPGADRLEALIQQEIARERERLYGEKRKNDLVGLDDDGEFIYYEDDPDQVQRN